MKIDRSKIKRSTTEVPPDCKSLILRIVDCKETQDLTELLKGVQTWTYGKCELYHWIDALDRFDAVLSKATFRPDGRWAMACDVNDDSGRELKQCVLQILRFTSLLIEHSFSRTVYNSMDYLTELLYSSDLTLLLENLHLLFMFSKRSNLLTRLPDDKRGLLLEGLYALAESWGGKEAGFGLAACCLKRPLEDYPPTATTVHMEFYRDGTAARNRSESWTVLHIEDVHLMNKSPSRILDECIDIYDVPQDKQLSLLTHLRLAYYFPVWSERVKLVQARLQALSILVYANAIQENIQQLLYSGLMEELVDILELSQDYLTDIKAAALRTLTSIIHLDRAHNFPNIIEATGAGSYHGFLPMMVRNCINSLTSSTPDASQQYPLPLATALFSFLYHLASYELGGEALVNCGMLESLLKVVNWETSDVEYITFVTRAVRVIDLITNMDMQAFQAHNGLTSFINRLEIEVAACRADQPFEIVPEISSAGRSQSAAAAEAEGNREEGGDAQMDTDSNTNAMSEQTASTSSSRDGVNLGSASSFVHNGTTCLPQRAALLKSMLNFLKKVIQDPAFSDSIRHIMESSLPNSLKHIISNAEYYGASLFLLAIDVVTVYVFQEPSLLHSLQDNGLTDVITEALLMKDVPPTREVISSMPNVFSALCLNSRGLNAFIKCNPFQSLFKVLLSPEYLPAMRRRRTAEPMGDTASNLGNAMDELMRHQPSLKVAATTAIIQLLKHLGCLGGDTTNTCMKSQAKPMVTTLGGNARAGTSEGGSSDEEDDDDEEASTASHTQPAAAAPAVPSTSRDAAPVVALNSGFLGNSKNTDEKLPLPLVDYILNVMKCVDAILSNNSTDDHCREFVNQQGLDPLLNILCLRILPIDFPNSPACQAVSSVCKSILNLAHEGLVLDKGLEKLHAVLMRLDVLDRTIDSPGSSVLLRELANSKNPVEAVGNCLETPILHDMTAVHSLIMMFIHVCRTGQSDIRTLSINHWGSKTGLEVLRLLSKLYLNLVWESTVLLALCSGEYQPDLDGFGRADLDKLIPPSDSKKENEVSFDGGNDIDSQPIVSSPSQDSNSTMETQQDLSRSCDGESWDQMDVDSESNMAPNPGLVNSSTQTSTKQDKEKTTANDTLQHYAKLLKPILSASSRLGRALAELFGLLVKLCVGSPLRQRRGHHMPAMQGYLSTTATQVAEVLAQLLNNGLKWQPKPNSPVPMLTFSICAVGFSAPLLFDEKKYPYHLMLRQFTEADGLSALFEVFYWAIAEGTSDASGTVTLPNEQVEFLDSWLLLMEKFVNPKLVLESPHSLPLKSPILRNPFNANLFLANVHKRAFDAVMFLWRRYDLKLYGTRAVESMLAILCHILRYREQSKLAVKGKDGQTTQTASQARTAANASSAGSTNDLTSPPEVTTPNPRAGPSTSTLGSSGIVGMISVPSASARSESGTAMATTEATPAPPPTQPAAAPAEAGSQSADDTATTARTTAADIAAATRAAAVAAVAAGAAASGTSAAGHLTAAYELGINVDHLRQLMDMGFSVEMCIEALITSNSLHQATDYLLNANTQPTVSTTTTSTADPSDQEMLRLFTNLKSEETVEHLKPEDLDSFTETIMDQCLKILDTVPESVYRVCELLVAVGQRNGSAWMEETLTGIVAQIESGIETIYYAIEKDVDVLLTPEFKTESAPVAHRIHLFSLMFEELKGMSAMALEKKHVIDAAIELIRIFHDRCMNSSQKEELKKRTPTWLAPLTLMIDLYEKAAVAAKRRIRVAEETDHIWKWFDINSGKWCSYSSQNNYIIDKAFWDGESMVRITAGRRRYVINFTAMIQLNEETSNRRPITLWLKSNENAGVDPLLPLPSPTALNALAVEFNTERLRDLYSFMGDDEELLGGQEEPPEVVSKPVPKLTKESTTSEQEPHVDTGKTPRLKGLDMAQKKQIVESTTMLMGWPVNPDALHAIMRLILRLTRSYEVAEVFSEHGGVRYLTTLTSDSGFSGFFPLANLLIRHVLEDSQSLKYAIEKMIRAKALSSGASTCKELHYLLRVLAPIACRHEEYFVEVAGGILRVDISFVTRRGEEDTRLIVKPISCKLGNIEGPVGEQARNAIETLLDALASPNSREEEQKAEPAAQVNVTTADIGTQKSETPQGSNEEESMETDSVSVKTISKTEKSSSTADDPKKKQLIPKYAICQLLAESVHSYSFPCKIIAEHAFYRSNIPGLQEDCTALAFLLDKMLPASENSSEKDCSTAVRDLISAMAGCNHIPDAQAIVISEVKAALQRALAMRESPEKHSRIQGLAALICTMIETCPSAPPTQMVPVLKPTTLCMNQVVRLLIRKNVTIDLARIPHSLDLSSPYMATTVNAALKPLEVISRIVNQPVAANPNRPKSKPETTVQESVNNTHTGGTSNSEMTHAQGEETVEDADNTEHDISAAAESLLDATSESHTHEHDAPEAPDDDVLDEIMDQLLERDTGPSEELIITENTMMDSSSNRMDTEQDSTQRDSRDFGGNQYEEDHDHNDTSDSESEASNGDEDGEEEGEEEEDEDEEEEDDEDDDEDGASNFDDRGQEEWDDGFMRFTGLDRDEDLLMVQYGQDPENTPVFFTNNATYNLNVGLFDDPMGSEHSSGLRLSHPLLQPPVTDQPVTGTVTTRGHRSGRQRRYQYIQFNPRHPHPPAILQRLLGPSTAQEVIQLTTGQALNQGMRDARFLVMDATADQGISRNGASGSSGCVSNYTALHWWCEEAKALDGESLHDSVVACKRKIVECIEYCRDIAFEMRREMKKKQAEEKKNRTATDFKPGQTTSKTPSTAPSAPSVEAVAAEEYQSLERTLERMVDIRPVLGSAGLSATERNIIGISDIASAINAVQASTTGEPNTNGPVSMDNNVTETEVGTSQLQAVTASSLMAAAAAAAAAAATDAPEAPPDASKDATTASDTTNLANETKENEPTDSSGDGQTSLERAAEAVLSSLTLPPAIATSTGGAAATTEATGRTEPVPGPSGTQTINEDFKNILGDIDIPEGVDPSFLAALPEDMRQEVIAEHLRLQSLRARPQAATGQTETTSVVDVSPEFLAALPPNIQEEVLAQQRIEQQRRMATVSNPNDPMDTEAFFRNLQPSLRQAILADMEESQIAALPPDLAAEAQSLRREWESRNRQFLQDRLFSHGHHTNTTLSSILRNSGMRISSRYSIANVAQRAQWSSHWPRAPTTMATHSGILGGKVKGKQLVDNETLSCLLVLLFVDEPRLNTGRLHRVLRNLCYHSTTRQWVIRSLLSVMERANDCTINTPPGVVTTRSKVDHLPTTGTRSCKILVEPTNPAERRQNSHTPAWLNISLDAALGCRANVFLLQKNASSGGKKSAMEHRQIFIHPQAVPTICRHTLDVLSNLAKSFPSQFLPSKGRPSLLCLEPSLGRAAGVVEKKPPTPPPESKSRSCTSGKSKTVENMIDFWDHLLKLDSVSSSKKGKAVGKTHSSMSTGIDQGVPSVSFEASHFGQLISMFAYPYVRRSSVLTDKLLRLLSLISLGIPDTSGFGRRVLLEEPETPVDQSMSISKSHLKLIIDIITTKSCSEEGLEEATSLLLNLSYGPPSTRNKILELLTDGVRDLGNTVCSHIADLQKELQALRKDASGVSDEASGQGDHESDKGYKTDAGTIVDRFTKEKVIIQSASKGKAPTELQLPAMATLTSKSSSQAFFLRLLKVIINLRDAIRAAIKKHKQKGSLGGPPLMSSTIVGPNSGATGDAGPSNAVTTPARQRERSRVPVEDPIDGWPMDVDMEPFLYDSMDTSEPRDASRSTSASRVPRIRRSAASEGGENNESSLPPLVDADETAEDESAVQGRSSENRSTSKIVSSNDMKDAANESIVDEAKLLPRLSTLLDLDSLWETLSQCLLELGHTPDHHAVLVLQPAVEAFFLVHASSSEREDKKLNIRETREAQLAHLQQDLPPVSPIEPSSGAEVQRDTEMIDPHSSTLLDSTGTINTPLSPDTQKFLTFAETHRTVLNQILRQSTQHLADGPFSVLVDHTRVLDFDVKRRYFRTELERLDEGVRREDLAVHVRRSHVFEDSFRELQRRRAEEWKNRFYIVFEGEEGQDAGGLLREWYVIISREIFNPMYALFTTSPGDRVTYMINPSSHYNSSHLLYFKFVGRVIAKAIYDNKLLECYFTRSFYKHILGKYVKYTDMESEDYSFYQGLVFLMDHHISELGYDLTFSTEVQEFGVTEVRDLIPNGRNIAVTEENKMEYIRLVCQMKMTGAIRKQLNAFLEGFYDIIPKRLISIFNEQELELLISGLPNIDIEDLKSNTEYHKYQPNSLQIQWFWRALRSFDQAERAKFLQFVTGTSKVPLQGFGALEGMNGVQKFQIHRDDRSTDRLPSAHTCFNQLDLPAYETYDKLCTYLRKAIHECSEGFGFA